jgi:hypothetical protein
MPPSPGPNFEGWMQQHQDVFWNMSIADMTLPGTHDTAAWHITPVPLAPKGPASDLQAFAAKALPCLLYPWTLTQSESVTSQLDCGIRFLDLRVSVSASDGMLWTSHTLGCLPLQGLLRQVCSTTPYVLEQTSVSNQTQCTEKVQHSALA